MLFILTFQIPTLPLKCNQRDYIWFNCLMKSPVFDWAFSFYNKVKRREELGGFLECFEAGLRAISEGSQKLNQVVF